jgi:hypothetical protein
MSTGATTTLMRKRIGRIVAAGCALSIFLGIGVLDVRARPTRKELLQSKNGIGYIAAMVRLRLRSPGRDARNDLASGDRSLYCVGTYACWPPGVDGDAEGFSVQATATTGCVIEGGNLEMLYRREEERYVERYNRTKLAAYHAAH